MAKKKPQEFQSIHRHIPHIEAVRTDIRVHCQTETMLSDLLKGISLEEEEFNTIFESEIQEATTKKKRKGKAAALHILRVIFATHLNLLWHKARLENFQQTVNTEKFHQQEIIKFKQANPEVANLYMDFLKSLSHSLGTVFLKSPYID